MLWFVPGSKRVPLGALAEQVATNLRQIREKRRLSYTEIAARLEELGRPIPILGLRRIERGERRVDLDDLAALARALHVPPILLIFSVGTTEPIDVLPGQKMPDWDAIRWFIGERASPGDDDPTWRTSAEPLQRLHEHDVALKRSLRLTTDAERRRQAAERAKEHNNEARAESLLEAAALLESMAQAEADRVAEMRDSLRRTGLEPPTVPTGLTPLAPDTILDQIDYSAFVESAEEQPDEQGSLFADDDS
jgi:transcriptional regulator with XRE-family HTH domain